MTKYTFTANHTFSDIYGHIHEYKSQSIFYTVIVDSVCTSPQSGTCYKLIMYVTVYYVCFLFNVLYVYIMPLVLRLHYLSFGELFEY